MALTAIDTKAIVDQYRVNDSDTGSATVQIAILTARIRYLTEHFKAHKKDHGSRRGLLRVVGQRRKLQKYLKNKDPQGYAELIASLGLRR